MDSRKLGDVSFVLCGKIRDGPKAEPSGVGPTSWTFYSFSSWPLLSPSQN